MAPNTPARLQLRKWMVKHGWSQSSLAVVLGVKQPSVSKWLDRGNRPSPHLRKAIESLTGGDVAEADWMTPNERRLAGAVRGALPNESRSAARP